MPQRTELHVNAPLSALSIAFTIDGFIADRMSPRFGVNKESDLYYTFDASNITVPDTTRARNAESRGIEWGTTTSTFITKPYALHDVVSQRDIDNADDPISPMLDSMETVTTLMNLDREKRVATVTLTAASYGSDNKITLTSTEIWDEATLAAKIRNQVRIAKQAIMDASLTIANTWEMSWDSALVLDTVDEVVASKLQINDRMEALRSGLPPQLFGLDLVVGAAAENTAAKDQTVVLARVWTDTSVVAFIDPAPRRKTRTLGLSFDYRGRVVREIPEPLKGDATRVEVEDSGLAEVLIDAGCGYLLINTLT